MEQAVAAVLADVFVDCWLGLDVSLTLGEHGVPLMGWGEWIEGLNLVV